MKNITFPVPSAYSFPGSTTVDAGSYTTTISGGTMTRDDTPLEIYFSCPSNSKRVIIDGILEDPPAVSEIVHSASMLHQGIEAQERATDLLGQMAMRTLQYAINFQSVDRALRPVYANKIWEILINALAMAEGQEAEYARMFIAPWVESRNPVKRQAAVDAMESLTP